jgi:two-component system, cell cycle response regulator
VGVTRPRVLVAEDSGLLRRILGDALRERGYDVLEAPDGSSALDLARDVLPDVLLLDREMPGLDGMQVLDAVRADPATKEMPVVFVTGHTDAADLAEGLERGAHDYVRKPVEPVELDARIRTALRLRALREELARRNAELEELARTDVLTGLANRRHAQSALQATLASARRHDREVSVVLLDIDNFKAVNDSLGHAAGDEVLRQVAAVLATGLRTEDLATRWGGEEFLILLPDVPAGGAATTAERLREAIEQAPDPSVATAVTASFGWATWNGEESVEALVARADDALYAAKAGGRNRVAAATVVADAAG